MLRAPVMASGTNFSDLIRGVRAGDQHAAAELVRLYEPHIRRAVRVRMNDPSLRQVIDSMDICQSVLANFFVRTASGEFEIDTPRQLVALLTTMARNRLRDWQRGQRMLRRDRAREVRLAEQSIASPAPGVNGRGGCHEQAIADRELLQKIHERLPAAQRRLMERRTAGESWAEIARPAGESPDALRMQLRRALDEVLRELKIEA